MGAKGREIIAFAVGAAMVAALSVGVAIGGAGSTFSDVGAEHPFVDEIEAIAGVGVSAGFADGTYRPGSPVTRQAMAAFLARGLGRVAYATGQNPTVGETYGTVAEVDLTSGAVGGVGLALVTGTAEAFTLNGADCPCRVQLRIRNVTTTQVSQQRFVTLQAGEDELGASAASMSVQGVFGAHEGTDHFALEALVTDADSLVIVTGALSALYVPFEGDGTPLDGAMPLGEDFTDARG